MQKIGLIVDEGADLPKEIIERHQIEVVSFKMDWPDLENLPGENTFQKMREAEKRGIKSFGKTSQPSPKDFLEAFQRQFEKPSTKAEPRTRAELGSGLSRTELRSSSGLGAGPVPHRNKVSGAGFEELICITISSKHSGTYNSACQAKNFLEPEKQGKVFVLDSLNGSSGQGLLTLRAVDLIKKGDKKAEEIFKDLEVFRSKITLRAILKDPKWLEASGRISPTIANWVRRIGKLGLRPLLGIKKGTIKAIGIKTGAKDIPIALFKEFEERTKKLRRENKKILAAITHGDNLAMAQKLKELLEGNFKEVEVSFVNLIDNVLGVIVGPDTLVLAWSEIT